MTMQAVAMTANDGGRGTRFTIYHGFAASLALHALLSLPFILSRLEPVEDDRSTLVLEMDGLVSDDQADEKVQQDTAGQTQQAAQNAVQAQQPTPPSEQKPVADDGSPLQANAVTVSTQAPAKPEPAGSTQVNGVEEQQLARTIAHREVSEETLRRAYGKLVSKKIHGRLVYPEAGRRAAWRGVTKVSFFILAGGQIRSDSVKVVSSSGEPQLDAAAMQTVRVSAPFGPPPREMNVAIDVVFGPER
ncbi:TonB family protein [Methylosinus sp. H3A]|uniref:TonB family protein n=1 Tax=Methylosinus sp. H3A TaxID=2785786 RepID=UPI0018C27045|nr:TonB family protein [Methylosinus sp. H3A]MBG0811961.1 TonB family protein [Methylosinus sp. H3A]